MYSGVNIESSAICNLRCRMCPTTNFPQQARSGYLDVKTFDLARPFLEGLSEGAVDLTGWGEPLMNPYLPVIIERLPGVTFTTNGHFMDSRWAERLVRCRVGAVAFSIDAAGEETYVAIHGRGDFAVVWQNVAGLRKARDFVGARFPFISVHFLMMKLNLKELPDFIDRAAEAGADEVVTKHIALFARQGQEHEALFSGYFSNTRPDEAFRDEILRKTGERAKERGIAFRLIGSNIARPVAGCFGGALDRPFITIDGSVAPCCVLAHEIPRLTPSGEPSPAPMLFFGNLRKETLKDIWQLKEYKAFRDAIKSGNPPPQCKYCLGAWSVTVDTWKLD
jgi:MoaA/NifB/PqqE/SkfB family radical SAM enzyme